VLPAATGWHVNVEQDAISEKHARARKGPFFVHAATARYAGTLSLKRELCITSEL